LPHASVAREGTGSRKLVGERKEDAPGMDTVVPEALEAAVREDEDRAG
jgi:hypothetical protein